MHMAGQLLPGRMPSSVDMLDIRLFMLHGRCIGSQPSRYHFG